MVQRGRLSYAAYSQTPDDGKRYEFLGGEVYVSPPPSIAHQYTLVELLNRLKNFLHDSHPSALVLCAPLAVVLADEPPADAEIVEPDIVIVQDRSTLSLRAVERPPFVAVEIVSPSRPWLDRKIKFERYAVHGIPHYWIVDPIAEVMECFRLADGHYVVDAMGTHDEHLSVPVFPGLVIDLGSLWLRLPRQE